MRRFEGSNTQRTYAYSLVDHLRWLEREALEFGAVTLMDLERYMGAVGAEIRMPFGEPWRAGKRPYGKDALGTAATVLKAFYTELALMKVNVKLGIDLNLAKLPTALDRSRSLLGHVKTSMPANPLTPTGPGRRHPKLPPENARPLLLKEVNTARDRMVIDWLADGGFRIGELCGLHLSDLHLRDNSPCREARSAHAHVCHRSGNRNHASAKTKYPWALEDGMSIP
ncbi:integrase [Planomonospora sphaerica]|uniref:Integrase n=1 Tax=Planomonospora sphaerica TaxID=161355 RepID=A0A171DL13_9ACTN|nr:integrase [Planomonospora sphaerica]